MCSMIVASAVQITYTVDMSVYQAVGLFSPTNGDTVLLGGSPFGWVNPPTFVLTNNPTGTNPYLYSGTYDDAIDAPGSTEYHEFDINVTNAVPGLNYGVGVTYGPTLSCVVPSAPTNLPTVYFSNETSTNTYVRVQATFQLNMSVQMARGNFNPANGDTVVVDGAINNWSTNASPLTVSANTNIYVGNFTIPGFTDQSLQYAFVILPHGGTWIWENSDRNFSFTNSTEVVSAYFNNQTSVGLVPAIFQVNMGIEKNLGYFDPSIGDFVSVWGTFNNWASGVMLTNSVTDTNLYTGTVSDSPGTAEQYQFVIDNAYWGDSGVYPANAGGNQGGNRTFTLQGPSTTLPVVYMGFLNLGNLTTSPVSANQTTITWNVAAVGAGIYLQTAGSLNGPWQAVPGTADAGTAMVNIGASNALFRLAGPQ